MAGILSYGIYVPRFRIKTEEIAKAWNKTTSDIQDALLISEKAVSGSDEDSITMGVEASTRAISNINIDPKLIESLFVGSESHPYAVNPSSTIIAEALGMSNDFFSVDMKFACKAATAAMQLTTGLLESKRIKYGLIIGSDKAQARPHDILEYTASSMAAAYILTSDDSEAIATIESTSSFSSNTPDFWRRDGVRYPSHFGRFTGQPAYFTHVISGAKSMLAKMKLKPEDFDYCIFHMPNGKFPQVASKQLGFTSKQLKPSLIVENLGNPYTASALSGLANILDNAKPNQKIFFVSYGSGAGSDAFVFNTTKNITKYSKNIEKLSDQIKNKKYINYLEYLQKSHKLN